MAGSLRIELRDFYQKELIMLLPPQFIVCI